VCIAPNRLSQAKNLLNMLFSQIIQLNTQELPEQNKDLKEICLLLLDEFTALGKVEIIEKAISYIAGYNLRLLLIYQSESQLANTYSEESAKNMLTNCGCQIIFAPREQLDAENYSKLLGTTTIQTQNYSYNSGGKDASGKNISLNYVERALMLPQELKEMGQNIEIILLENCKPIKANKIKYYEDAFFTQKLLPKVEIMDKMIKDEWLGVCLKAVNKINKANTKQLNNEALNNLADKVKDLEL
jgi:type IV secretion system protein VirD4